MDKLKAKSPWTWRYLRYGHDGDVSVQKVKAGAGAKASTCSKPATVVRLDRTGEAGDCILANGPAVSAHRCRNPERFDLQSQALRRGAGQLTELEQLALVAVLNSTLVGSVQDLLWPLRGNRRATQDEVVDVN